jgi:hypothetical protein
MERRREVDHTLILNALKSGPKRFMELYKTTELPRKTLSFRLKDLLQSKYIIKKDGYYFLNGTHLSNSKKFLEVKKLHVLKNNIRIIALIMLWLVPTTMVVYALMTKQTQVKVSSQSPVASFSILPTPQPNIGWELKEAKIIAGETVVVFNASSAYDPDGKIANYVWDFGDGHSSLGMLVQHIYSKPGKYTIKLTVFDDEGKSNVAYKELIVYDRPIARIYLQIGEFSDNVVEIYIVVANITDLYGWQLGLSFNATALNCLSFEKASNMPSTNYNAVRIYNEGIFAGQHGLSLWFPPRIDNEQGVVYLAGCTLTGNATPASGCGTLAKATFKVLAPSTDWNLRLINVILGTKSGEEIPVNVDNILT